MLIRFTIVTALLGAVLYSAVESGGRSRPLTGAEKVCFNRCEANNWPRGCFEDCMRRWR